AGRDAEGGRVLRARRARRAALLGGVSGAGGAGALGQRCGGEPAERRRIAGRGGTRSGPPRKVDAVRASVVAALLAAGPATLPHITASTGAVRVGREGAWRDAAKGMEIGESDFVAIADGATVSLTLA